MKNQILLITGILCCLFSCSPKISSDIIDPSDSLSEAEVIHVYEVEEDIPQNSEFKGKLEIGEIGLTKNCNYDLLIAEAKKLARRSGANLVKMIEVKSPGLVSTCPRIKAELYRNDEIETYGSLEGDTAYALIHFYRPKNFFGSAIKFKIYSKQGELIGALQNNSKFSLKMIDFGDQIFWSPKVGRDSLHIDIEKGKEYFIKCKMAHTFTSNFKQMELIRAKKGKQEVNSIKSEAQLRASY
ncbi:MAG: hypothetical protein R8P61_17730 [Bacteroidia bacterium]|nr:hypothetical protein [Bacteroidia bacterium]